MGRRKEGKAVNGGTIGSFSNDDGDGSKDVIKAIRLLSKKRKQIYACITPFCAFLCRHCTTMTFYEGRKQAFLSILSAVPKKSTRGKFAYI